MKNDNTDIIQLNEGMEHDLNEGWHKLASRQQGGRAAKAIKEPIQNALDSYPPEIPIRDRRGEIITGRRSIAIKDFSLGMSREQIPMLYTVGGTSKFGINSMIGNFGLGFKQLFNFRMGTTKVRVTTMCHSHPVMILFTVKDPKSVPEISIKVLKNAFTYGTMVKVFFNNDHSAGECLEEAVDSLRYYPCRFTINGTESISAWDKARKRGAHFFEKEGIEGFIQTAFRQGESRITVLCKYEYIVNHYITHFMAGNARTYHHLGDYANKETPYIPGLQMVVNSNDLHVVISRDSYYCDKDYNHLVAVVNQTLLEYLADLITENADRQFILANIYCLRYKIKKYLENPGNYHPEEAGTLALKKLVEMKVFKVAEQLELFSIRDIINNRTKEFPLFISPEKHNVRWLGGQFKHDFVITPHDFTLEGGLRNFYNTLFYCLFNDVVNLDQIHLDATKLKDLVKRGIVDPEALLPNVRIRGNKALNRQQKTLQAEINSLLSRKEIIKVIEEQFNREIRHIETAFFEVADAGMYISTGLFDEAGKPLTDEYITNISDLNDEEKGKRRARSKQKILLGLNVRHPLISYLSTCLDPDRAAYSMTYLVNQLIMCQRSLVPFSSFYKLDKTKMAKDIRTALIHLMTHQGDENNQ